MISFAVLVVLVVGLYTFTDWFSKFTGYFTGEEEKVKLIKCLNDNNAEFYGTSYCADCAKQIELFGQNFKAITYIDCGRDKGLCPNIREIPAWLIGKQIHYGFKDIGELKSLANCGE